eukprot:CAMPEP_0176437400 /NCGR_PEP_ID=MMETSP0127-20121128/18597_1 /TAXON_ID=938130 /ORGANISM="Platyophrya macrostoma, Strain WH" /LENGTH=209 /DNA_ID=CAMNT_0017821015 /DNA_START=122 /DNA_END=751 /DNA_ORIENTATION=-
MGEKQSKPVETPKMDVDDMILELRMKSKQLERESNRSKKESEKEVVKAKAALKKNNEEGAKLYLQTAQMKHQESINYQKMANRMEAISTQIKTNMNNTKMVEQLRNMTPLLQQQIDNVPLEKVAYSMQEFQKVMDNLTIQSNIMSTTMNEGMANASTESNVDMMMDMLKKEVNAEIQEKMLDANQPMTFNQMGINNTGPITNTQQKSIN